MNYSCKMNPYVIGFAIYTTCVACVAGLYKCCLSSSNNDDEMYIQMNNV